jgi:hypothetical protein
VKPLGPPSPARHQMTSSRCSRRIVRSPQVTHAVRPRPTAFASGTVSRIVRTSSALQASKVTRARMRDRVGPPCGSKSHPRAFQAQVRYCSVPHRYVRLRCQVTGAEKRSSTSFVRSLLDRFMRRGPRTTTPCCVALSTYGSSAYTTRFPAPSGQRHPSRSAVTTCSSSSTRCRLHQRQQSAICSRTCTLLHRKGGAEGKGVSRRCTRTRWSPRLRARASGCRELAIVVERFTLASRRDTQERPAHGLNSWRAAARGGQAREREGL